jgi:isocitrate dehydrogenase
MINTSDTRRKVERALASAIEDKIQSHPMVDPEDIVKSSLAEFNEHFAGVYKIDTIKRTKDFLGITISKDKDDGERELVNA